MNYILPAIISAIFISILIPISWKINKDEYSRTVLIVRLVFAGLAGWIFITYFVHMLIESWISIMNNPFLLILVISGFMSIIAVTAFVILPAAMSNDRSVNFQISLGFSVPIFMLFFWFSFAAVIFCVWLLFPGVIYVISHNFIVGFAVGFALLSLILELIFKWVQRKKKQSK